MKPSELLTKAKAVIADPKHWAQGFYAQDAYGEDVEASAHRQYVGALSGHLEKSLTKKMPTAPDLRLRGI